LRGIKLLDGMTMTDSETGIRLWYFAWKILLTQTHTLSFHWDMGLIFGFNNDCSSLSVAELRHSL